MGACYYITFIAFISFDDAIRLLTINQSYNNILVYYFMYLIKMLSATTTKSLREVTFNVLSKHLTENSTHPLKSPPVMACRPDQLQLQSPEEKCSRVCGKHRIKRLNDNHAFFLSETSKSFICFSTLSSMLF